MSKSALSGVNRILLRKVATLLGTNRHSGLKMKTDQLVDEIITRAPDANEEQITAIREIPELQEGELAAVESILVPKVAAKPKGKAKKAEASAAANGESAPAKRRTRTKEAPEASAASPGHEDLIMRLDALSKDLDGLTVLAKAQATENAILKNAMTVLICAVFEPIDSLEELMPQDPDGE